MIQKYSDNGPKECEKTEELFPKCLTGSFAIEPKKYYFFRGNRFCLRKIETGSQLNIQYEEEETIEVYKIDEHGNQKLVSIQNVK